MQMLLDVQMCKYADVRMNVQIKCAEMQTISMITESKKSPRQLAGEI